MAKYNALGMIETFGLVFVLEAADAMVKAADVELVGYENTASGYISVLVAGDIAACQSAVDAGVKGYGRQSVQFRGDRKPASRSVQDHRALPVG